MCVKLGEGEEGRGGKWALVRRCVVCVKLGEGGEGRGGEGAFVRRHAACVKAWTGSDIGQEVCHPQGWHEDVNAPVAAVIRVVMKWGCSRASTVSTWECCGL